MNSPSSGQHTATVRLVKIALLSSARLDRCARKKLRRPLQERVQTPTLFLIGTDLTKMQVDTNVSESDIGATKEGNKATFTVDAYPKRTFEGTVSQIRQSPQTVQNVITYDVVISVDNSDLALKPGLTAATRIIIDERNDAIRVPIQALRCSPAGIAGRIPPATTESDQTQIWILRDGKPTAVPVVVGLDDDSFVEIVEGNVKPGDQVIVAEQIGTVSQSVPPPRF